MLVSESSAVKQRRQAVLKKTALSSYNQAANANCCQRCCSNVGRQFHCEFTVVSMWLQRLTTVHFRSQLLRRYM